MDKITTKIFDMRGPIILVFSGIIMIILSSIGGLRDFQSNILMLSGITSAIIGGMISSLIYLRGEKLKSSNDTYINNIQKLDQSDLDLITETIQRELKVQNRQQSTYFELSENERKEITKSIVSNIPKKLSDEILESIKLSINNSVSEEKCFKEFREEQNKTKIRLINEIDSLTRRGNLNLVIGGFTTILAVSLLGYIVLTAKLEVLELKDFIWHYIPRITVSIFIQIFSFFFLKLYKTSLQDIKYFQNELTNIDSKFLALDAALIIGDKNIISEVIKEVSITDRNSKLKKGETTIDLERLKAENKSLSDMLLSTKDIINSLKK